MFRTIAACALLLVGAPAVAQDLSALLRDSGLAGTIATLEARADPSAEDLFVLGGAHFLRGVERALQARYRFGMDGRTIDLPVLRLQVPPNPAPEPFHPEVVRQIFADLHEDMARARAALERIGGSGEGFAEDFGAELSLADLWFDIDGDGRMGPTEPVAAQFGATLLPAGRSMVLEGGPVIRFDRADAAWLAAYTHFLSAIAQVVLAYDPTEAIAQVQADAEELDSLYRLAPPANALDYMFRTEVDALTMAYRALQKTPDAGRIGQARDHLLAMIRLNREVWTRVAVETDDDREWIPSARQASGLGLTVPPQTGPSWLAVLDDAEAMIEGRKLIPHWRLGSGAGVNLARMLADPPPLDVVGWMQGGALLPYAEPGKRVSMASWRQFERMVQGDALLFAVFLN